MSDTLLKGKRTVKQRIVTVLIHLLAILIFIVLPEVMMNIADTVHSSIPLGVYSKMITCVVLYYLNYFFVFSYCFDRPKGTTKFLLINLLLIVVALVINYYIWELQASHLPIHGEGFPGGPPPPIHKPGTTGHIAMVIVKMLRDGIIYLSVVGLCVAIKFSIRWTKAYGERQELIAKQREEELASLRSQINPHFLFNTLNTIYALIELCPNKARKAVHALSQMMRYLLYENQTEVILADELKFVSGYIDLMKMRLGESLPWSITLDAGNSHDVKIAPVLFMTVVENVFKHGITNDRDCKVEILIVAEDGVVKCRTFNYYNAQSDKIKTQGIGLENLSRRLELLYGNKATLKIDKTENTFTLNLNIDLNNNHVNN